MPPIPPIYSTVHWSLELSTSPSLCSVVVATESPTLVLMQPPLTRLSELMPVSLPVSLSLSFLQPPFRTLSPPPHFGPTNTRQSL